MIKLKCSCIKCKSVLTVSNIKNHYNSKSCNTGGIKPPSNNVCAYCNISTKGMSLSQSGNHVRWCLNNPKRPEYVISLTNRLIDSVEVRQKRSNSVSNAHKRGAYEGSGKKSAATRKLNGTDKHSEETKLKMSIGAKKSNHQRVCKSTHIYTDKRCRTFKFDSKWEDALADRLDFLNIVWDRPAPISYFIKDIEHKYYPDFYLLEYDIYLDPKNSYCLEKQKIKLEIVSKQITLIILHTLEECKNFNVV